MSMESLKIQPIWLAWRYETKNGKRTKVPYQENGSKASTTDSKTWCTFDKASQITKKDGIGIVFESSQKVVGIDFDHCLAPFEIPDWLSTFLVNANTYVEFSPSKTGCHVLFTLSEHVNLESNKHHFDQTSCVEVYSSGRYFTFSQDEMPQSKAIRNVTPDEFISLLQTLGYPWQKKKLPSPSPMSVSLPLDLTDEEILQKMFASRHGEKIQLLYNGDTSLNNNDLSSADFSLCLHLAYWTGKNESQMSRLWLASPLAARDKTQKREDYRARTIKNAIEATQNVFMSTTLHVENSEKINYKFFLTDAKNPSPMLAYPNIIKVLRLNPFFQNKFRKNEYSHLVETNSSGEWVPLNDDAISKAREFISENFAAFRRVSKDMVTDAILCVSNDCKVNPPRDYFSSLTWDQKPRLNSWLHHTFGVADDELHQAIGSNWLKGLVKRVMKPGCQFDEVLALESPQGWRKSSSVRVLGEPWHVETTHSIDNKDFYLLLAQNVIVEFSEGEIFDRASVNKIKAEVTKTEDQVRPPYERGIIKFKRSCVFAVTTNKLELKDDTGNRRWLPVTLERPADIAWLKENRDQLFAEAYYRVIILNESTHEYPTELLEEVQQSRGEWSDYDEKVLLWYASLFPIHREEQGIALHDVCAAAFGHDTRIGKLEELQAASMLRRTLHLENRNKKVDGAVLRRWFPTEKTRKILQKIDEAKIPSQNSPADSFHF